MAAESKHFEPFVPSEQSPPEFTLAPIVMGTLLGILFGASSVYLVLKVGLTVSASIPVAVLAFALFRLLSGVFGFRKTSILENNIAQTAGSAGESIAFGVGLCMPALLVLGYDIDVVRVMTVGVFGGLLGILMMIPLRRAFIVQKHGELKYPEGTACADVLIAGEKGGSTAGTLVIGLILGFVYQFLMLGFKFWQEIAAKSLFWTAGGKTVGLKGAAVSCEMSAPLLGVGYIIGPRIAGIMVAGGVLAYLVISPMIAFFGEGQTVPLLPAKSAIDAETGVDKGLIRNMSLKAIRDNYILFIGAGAVAAGGIISMLKALPVIVGSIVASMRDLRRGRGSIESVPRTERDLPMSIVFFGSLGMILALAAAPHLGLGFTWGGLAGALMVLFFSFLFVTVSSRLCGEIGSSSNPISGMTVATLLLTCIILLGMSEAGLIALGKETKLLALTIAGVVCIACSNGGTTSQALKTGHLLGATPLYQQYAILIGSLVSALVVGIVLIWLNQAGTIYTKRDLPKAIVYPEKLADTDNVRAGQYSGDKTVYKVLLRGDREKPIDTSLLQSGMPDDVPPGRYFIGADGTFQYRCDPGVNGKLTYEDAELEKPEDQRSANNKKFDAPKTQLVSLVIDGVLDRNLPWDLVIIGVLIALTLELSSIPSLPFAVGVYLPLSSSMPIFIGGMVRWLVDKMRRRPDEGDSSPGVLLSSGYIAGGAIAALLAAFMAFDKPFEESLDYGKIWTDQGKTDLLGVAFNKSNLIVTTAFASLTVILILVGWLSRRKRREP